MYKPQRGCLPYFISTIGALFFIGLIAGNLILNIKSWFSIRLSMPLKSNLKYIISNLAVSLIIIIIFLPFPLFLAEMFPAVRVSKESSVWFYGSAWRINWIQ